MEQHPLFSSRDSLDEAVVYGVQLLNTLPPEHRRTAFTAFHTLANTALKLAEPPLRNLTPSWEMQELEVTPSTPDAVIFQYLRNMVAPLTDAVIMGDKRAKAQDMEGSLVLGRGSANLLRALIVRLAQLSGLDEEAHEKEYHAFHDKMEEHLSKSDSLGAVLVRILRSRG